MHADVVSLVRYHVADADVIASVEQACFLGSSEFLSEKGLL